MRNLVVLVAVSFGLGVVAAGVPACGECDWAGACKALEGAPKSGARVCGEREVLSSLVGTLGIYKGSGGDGSAGGIIKSCSCQVDGSDKVTSCKSWVKEDCAAQKAKESCTATSIWCLWTGSACAWQGDLPVVGCSFEAADCLEGLCMGCSAGGYGSCPPGDSAYTAYCRDMPAAKCDEMAQNPELDKSPGKDGLRSYYRNVMVMQSKCP